MPEELSSEYESYEQYLNGLGDSTYFMMGNGPSYSLKVARKEMTNRDIVKNIMHGAYRLASLFKSFKIEFESIRQISIKTYNSPSLPIYNYLSAEEISSYRENLK